jgi:hypothetical protein
MVAVTACGDNDQRITLGGSVTGLKGTGLVLTNGLEELAIEADGTFEFATRVAAGAPFEVTVVTHPTTPTQSCVVAGGSGTSKTNVTNISVTCMTGVFMVGGNVSGLLGSGLVLENNGEELAVSADGAFSFPTPVPSGAAFAVTVKTHPSSPTQACTVTDGSGTVGGTHVTSVMVSCSTSAFTVGGTVSGLAGGGLVLRNNGGNDLTITQNGTFTFTTPIASGAAYAATVFADPTSPWQTCTVANGSGNVANAAVTNIAVTCTTNTYTIGGTVAGLSGTGLVLQNNNGDDLNVSGSTFTFATPVASGTSFTVTVKDQPTGPTQTCTVAGGTGTVGGGNVTSVMINCTTNSYAISGNISGLSGTVVLQNNGSDDLTLTADGTFSFSVPVLSGDMYNVTVLTNPSSPISQTCAVAAGSGTVGGADVTNVDVLCTTNPYTIGGTVTGLAPNQAVVLQNNGTDDLTVSADGSFTFSTSILSGQTYAVTVLTNPASPISQTCNVAAGSGTVGGANVTTVDVLCTANPFTIGGTVRGLKGSGLVLRNNGGNDLTVTANGTFTFSAPVASGLTYNVTVQSSPTSPPQSCVVAAGTGSGTVGTANVTSVVVTCAPTCAQLVTNANVWGRVARGVDLRPYTNSTLDWIGCPGDGCQPSDFFCTEEANGIFFGSNSSVLRALPDPGNAAGDPYPTTYSGCASSPGNLRSISNAPMANNAGVGGLNAGDALCKSMGFASGVVVLEVNTNFCPKPHTTIADGSNWTSTFAHVDGYGQQYRCTR